MNTPDFINEATTGSTGFTCGTFPKQLNTVTAEVLARLLTGEKLTGMSAVFNASTTRLAAVVHRLRRQYGWAIESGECTVSTADGRIAEISAYTLPGSTAVAAISTAVANFCESVKAARLELRMAKG